MAKAAGKKGAGMATVPSQRSGGGDPLDLDSDPTIPKAKEAVQIKEPGDLTLHDRRLFNHLLGAAYEDLATGEKSHEVPLSALRSTRDSHHKGTERVKESVERLQRTLVQFYDQDLDKWISVQLLGMVEITRNKVTYEFHQKMRGLLSNPAQYARISLRVIYHFSSKYSIALYEHLMLYARRRHAEWTVSVDDLRGYLGTGDKLTDFAQLQRRAIGPAVAEIVRFSPLWVELEPLRRGRKVEAVKFKISMKPAEDLQDVALEQAVDLPLFSGRELLPEAPQAPMLDTPASREALGHLRNMTDDERLHWLRRAQEIQMTQDGYLLLLENSLSIPEFWCHYVAEEILAVIGGALLEYGGMRVGPRPT